MRPESDENRPKRHDSNDESASTLPLFDDHNRFVDHVETVEQIGALRTFLSFARVHDLRRTPSFSSVEKLIRWLEKNHTNLRASVDRANSQNSTHAMTDDDCIDQDAQSSLFFVRECHELAIWDPDSFIPENETQAFIHQLICGLQKRFHDEFRHYLANGGTLPTA